MFEKGIPDGSAVTWVIGSNDQTEDDHVNTSETSVNFY